MPKVQFKKMDEKIFTSVLKAQTNIITKKLSLAQALPIYSDACKSNLNICVSAIINAIHQSMTLSSPKMKNSGWGEP